MPAHKFAISLPDDVFLAISRAATERGLARSRFIADILRAAAQAKTDDEIRARIDAVFASPAVLAGQRENAALFMRAGSDFGTEW